MNTCFNQKLFIMSSFGEDVIKIEYYFFYRTGDWIYLSQIAMLNKAIDDANVILMLPGFNVLTKIFYLF